MDYKARKKEVDEQIWYYANEVKTKVYRFDSATRELTQEYNAQASKAMNDILTAVEKNNKELQNLEVLDEIIEFGTLCKDFGNEVVNTLIEKRKQATRALNDYLSDTSKTLLSFSYESNSKCVNYAQESTGLSVPKTTTWENYSNKIKKNTFDFNSQIVEDFRDVTYKFSKITSAIQVELSTFNELPELELKYAKILEEEQDILRQLEPVQKSRGIMLMMELPHIPEEVKEKAREGTKKAAEAATKVWDATKEGAKNFSESATKVAGEVRDKAEARGWLGENASNREAQNTEKVLNGEKPDRSNPPSSSVNLNNPNQSNPSTSDGAEGTNAGVNGSGVGGLNGAGGSNTGTGGSGNGLGSGVNGSNSGINGGSGNTGTGVNGSGSGINGGSGNSGSGVNGSTSGVNGSGANGSSNNNGSTSGVNGSLNGNESGAGVNGSGIESQPTLPPTVVVDRKQVTIEGGKKQVSQDITFSGTSADIDKAKADIAATLGKNADIEITENPDGSLNVKYSADAMKHMDPSEKTLLDPGVKTTNPNIDTSTPTGVVPSTNSWGIDPVKDKVNKLSAQGNVSRIDDMQVTNPNGNPAVDSDGKPIYRKVLTFTDGTRVMVNPDGTEVPLPKLADHSQEQNPQISSKTPEQQEEDKKKQEEEAKGQPKKDGENSEITPEAVNATVTQGVNQQSGEKINDNRSVGHFDYPYWGVWSLNGKSFCWVRIKSYTNYQQGVSARARYDNDVRRSNEASTWTLLMPEKFSWSLTHQWGAYKGWATPIAEFAANLAKGTTELNSASKDIVNAVNTGVAEVMKTFAGGGSDAGKAAAAEAFSTVSKTLSAAALNYMKFDQAKTYNNSNDRGLSLGFEFLLGPEKSSAQYLWNMIHNMIIRSSPVKSDDSANANNMQEAWGFIPPDLFSVEVIPPGGNEPIWALYDCALVDISTNMEGPWLYPVGITPKVTLDLTFNSVAPTYSSNEPMQLMKGEK